MNFNTLKKTLIIAEIGVNHEGDCELAKQMIRQAAEAGADVVKFQTFTADHYVSTEQIDRFNRAKGFELTQEQFASLAVEAERNDVIFMSTPLHNQDIDFLKTISPIIKISSGDLTHLSLVRHAASTGLPLIISTGLGTEEEICAVVSVVEDARPNIRSEGGLMLMHCVAAYPTPEEQANLRNINWLSDKFDLPIGYSDHTIGTKACELAIAAGAVALEKHFTYRKENQDFHDHHISADPRDLKELVYEVDKVRRYMGQYERSRGEAELKLLAHMRRSIGTVRAMKTGEVVTREDLTFLRPQWGMLPDEFDDVVGKKLGRDLPAGALVRREDLKD